MYSVTIFIMNISIDTRAIQRREIKSKCEQREGVNQKQIRNTGA